MSDLVAWLRAQLDLDEAHARKDLWCVERATALGQWEACYGHNLPYSILQAGDVEVGRLTADRHAADLMLVSRMVRSAKARAERVLAEVEAKRQILDAFPADPDGCDDRVSFGGWESCSDSCAIDVMRHVLRLLALPYADRPGYDEAWRP